MRLSMLRSNPSELCDLPKTRRKEIRPMEQDKIGAFLQEIKGSKYELLYLVMLFTGMRQGEELGLTWDCVDFTMRKNPAPKCGIFACIFFVNASWRGRRDLNPRTLFGRLLP